MTTRPLKLGITLMGNTSVPELVEEAKKAESAGFDVILTPDHLGLAAPIASLVAIAHAAPSVQVSTLVLNASLYRPALLARELAAVDSATGGRLIIGLGTGYVEAEFDAAGLPFPSPGQRVKILADTMRELRTLLADPSYTPPPVQAPPPIMVAGQGDKMLALAAEHADIVGILSMADEAHLTERVAYVEQQAGHRRDDVELQFAFINVSIDDPSDLSAIRSVGVEGSDEDVRALPTVLDGSVAAAAERIQRFREELGISYFTFLKTDATSWATFEQLTAAAR